MFIPLSIQLDLQIHQPGEQLDENQKQNHTQDHIISLILNEDNNEKLIPSTLITIPKLENSSGLSILNEITSTSQTKPLSNSFISSEFNWNFFNKLPNVTYSGKDIDSIWRITTIPTRSHSRNWLSESSQVTFNLHPKLNSHPNAILNPKNDFNPYLIYKHSGSSNIELKEELPQLDDESNRIPQTSEDLNQEKVHSNDFNIFNDLEDPLPSLPSSSTDTDQSHELDFLL